MSHKHAQEPLLILVDKREQLPWKFVDHNVRIVYDILSVGDYSIFGFKDTVVIERKSLSDLFGSLNSDEKHIDFMAKLQRMSTYECKALVIESTYERILHPYNVHSRLHPSSVLGTLAKATAVLNIPVVFACGRRNAQDFVYRMFRHYKDSKTALRMDIDTKLRRTFTPLSV